MEDKKEVQDIRERLIRIETLLESNNHNIEDKISVANHRIADLENTISWLWRTSLVGVIGAMASLIFRFI